jgi:hypothetical protein
MARTTKVWHITDYAVLYKAMLPNRKGELDQVQYTQRHINPPYDKPEAVRCVNRFRALQQTRSIEQFLKIKFVYEELLDQSQHLAGEYKYLRGYVVDECMQPPSPKRICQMLPLLKPADVKMALAELARVQLIELVELPLAAPDEPLPEQPEQPEDEKPADNGLFDGESGECTSGAPQVHLPSQESEKQKNTRRPSASGNEERRKTRNRKGESSAAGAASEPNGKANAKTPAPAGPEGQQESRSPKPEGQAGQDREAAQDAAAEAETQTRTAGPRSEKPTGTDGSGGDQLDALYSANLFAGEVWRRLRMGLHAPFDSKAGTDGSGGDQLDALYSANLFAGEVWRRLRMGLHAPFDSKEGRSQFESFASVWQQACRALVQKSKLEAVRDLAYRQADQLGRKFERAGKKPFNKGHPGPVFNKKLKGLIAKYKPG